MASERVIVGTSSSGIGQLAYYQKTGFRLSWIERDFFNTPAATAEVLSRTASRCATWFGWTSNSTGGPDERRRQHRTVRPRGRDPRRCRGRSARAEATEAEVVRAPGVAVAAFPREPERSFYNNALLDGDLDASERADAIDAMEATYAEASITGYAAWVHEDDIAMRAELDKAGATPSPRRPVRWA